MEQMKLLDADSERRVQDWLDTGDGVIDVFEYVSQSSNPRAIEMPMNAGEFADGTVIAGQIIMHVFPLIHPTGNILPPGDVNFDGVFDSGDLVDVFQTGEYEDGVDNNSTWTEGDWTGDRDFTSADLTFAFESGGYQLQSGGGFFGLTVTQQDTLAQTLKTVRDANIKLDPLLEVLQLTERELEQILDE